MTRLLLIVSLIALAACQSDDISIPKDVLPKDKFAQIMIDVQLTEGLKSQYTHRKTMGSEHVRVLFDELFEKHGTSEEEFQHSFAFYREYPSLMEEIYEQVLDSLSTLEAQIKQEFSTQNQVRRDSVKDGGAKRYNIPTEYFKPAQIDTIPEAEPSL